MKMSFVESNGLLIRSISYAEAIPMIVNNHYLHRKCQIIYSFGLFSYGGLKGVITYGNPPSPSLQKGVCGPEETKNVIELNRLWIDDNMPKNSESFLIASTLKMIEKEIVVSFADSEQGHLGVIYQATNWIYTGLSDKHTEWKIEGSEKHSRAYSHQYTLGQLKEMFGDKLQIKQRSRKYRYVYINARSKKRRKELIEKLRYPSLPYPKHQAEAEVSHD